MMTAAKKVKQTAGNNDLLRMVRRVFNKLVFKRASEILNNSGPDACRDYLRLFFNTPYPGTAIDDCLARIIARLDADK